MFSKAIVLAFVAAVSAQGTVKLVTGDVGGSTAALGITGGAITDTTVFDGKDIRTDGFGRNLAGKPNTPDFKKVVKEHQNALPQVSDGGPIRGTWRVDSPAGGGPLRALLDSSCTGHFTNATELPVVLQIPGDHGTANGDGGAGVEHEFSFTVSRGVRCEGSTEGLAPTCLIKVANENGYGGVFAIHQILTGKDGQKPPAVKPSYPYDGAAPYNANPNARPQAAKPQGAKQFRA